MASLDDASAIAGIYNRYVRDTFVSFEDEPVSVEQMRARLTSVLEAHVWYVEERDGAIRGYAYAGDFHTRAAYRHTVETTIYVDQEHTGHGIGTALYEALIDSLRRAGHRCAIGIIALPNPGSVAIHERFGFAKVGHLRAAGRKFDRWIDVGIWQLML
jgi:L-amino acid N-acyltransferase YncA